MAATRAAGPAAQLQRLLTGLADQEILAGAQFRHDNATLYPDEVADLLLPSALSLAQDLSRRLGMGTWGYAFMLGRRRRSGSRCWCTRRPAARTFSKWRRSRSSLHGTTDGCRDDVGSLSEAAASECGPASACLMTPTIAHCRDDSLDRKLQRRFYFSYLILPNCDV